MPIHQFVSYDIYTKGDLKGYINGIIAFFFNEKETHHEFLYRFDDQENGPNFELVSIDYGYHVPNIDEVWGQIEEELKAMVSEETI